MHKATGMKAVDAHNLSAHASSVRPCLSGCEFILTEWISAPSNMALISAVTRLLCLAEKWNQTGTRMFVFVADVLFGLPLLLTLQKLAAEAAMEDAHHQLYRYSQYPMLKNP